MLLTKDVPENNTEMLKIRDFRKNILSKWYRK